MTQYDIAIIGGGAAGYFATIKLLEHNSNIKILLVEKQPTPLQKLLTTGNGACNFTHSGTIDDFLKKYGTNGNFLRNAFSFFFNDDIVSFFEDNGIKTLCRDDGKFFPKSMNVKDIRDLFIYKTNTVNTELNSTVIEIKKSNDIFMVLTETNKYFANNVLITTGGKSLPKTGSTGDGYRFAEKFGHTIIKAKPSLASIFCNEHILSDLSGIAFPSCKIQHQKGNKSTAYFGALLITHKGFSGPIIIDNSRSFDKGDKLSISFIHENSSTLSDYLRKNKTETVFFALKKYDIPKKMIHFICSVAEVNANKNICEISYKSLDILVNLLVSFTITVSSVEGFDSCMCTSGGISLKEIDPKTFESKIVNGLYFLGEVIDIDGDSGGYNLQAIWSECALFSSNLYLT